MRLRDAQGGGGERSGAESPPRPSHPEAQARRGFIAWLDRWPPVVVHLVAALLVAAVGALDLATGAELSFSIFYLLPIALVAWRQGTVGGAAWAAVAAAVWLGVGLRTGATTSLAIAYWNAAVRLGFFLIVAASLGRIRGMLIAERHLAGTDYLTGVLNGRAFHELVELERSRALRYNRPFTLAYLDVDGFKVVNTERGHSGGDDALQLIATTIRQNVRSMDTIARLGGDEFGLLFPETGTGAAEVALRKIQARLGEAMTEAGFSLTFSIGAVICVGPPGSVDQLIHRADTLMYAVKEAGKDGLRTEVLNDNFGIEAILRRS